MRRMAMAPTTTEAFKMLASGLLHMVDQEVVCHLHNPIVHMLIHGICERQRQKRQMAQFFSAKMQAIQKQYEQLEAAYQNEVYWEDDSDEEEEEDFYILDGKRITLLDLQAILEISAKLNLMEDATNVKSMEKWKNKLK